MITLKRAAPARPELMEVLERCHERMRKLSDLAVRLAAAGPETDPAEIADAARSVRRYFGVAFPLHGLDEEQSLIPRLRGLDPAVDAALARIEPDHRELDRVVEEVVGLTGTIEETPAALDSLRARLETAAAALRARLADHLAHEEATFLPAIERLLVPTQSEAILAEIRARRDAGAAMP